MKVIPLSSLADDLDEILTYDQPAAGEPLPPSKPTAYCRICGGPIFRDKERSHTEAKYCSEKCREVGRRRGWK